MEDQLQWPVAVLAATTIFCVMALLTILIVVVIRTMAANNRARVEIARDDAFRKLAESYDSLLQRSTVAARVGQPQLVPDGRRRNRLRVLLPRAFIPFWPSTRPGREVAGREPTLSAR